MGPGQLTHKNGTPNFFLTPAQTPDSNDCTPAPPTAPPEERPKQHPAVNQAPAPSLAPAAAPQTACPLHPAVNLAKMRLHRHPKSTKQHPPKHPAAPQTASQNATCTSTPSCMPLCTRPSRCKNVPAPSPARPIAPGRQYRKLRAHRHQHLKQLPKQHPKTPPAPAPQTACPRAPYRQDAKTRVHRHPQNRTCTSTPQLDAP